MLLPALLLVGAALAQPASRPTVSAGAPPQVGPAARVYDGRARELAVQPPRLDGPAVEIDGRLDEPVWREAAVLTGFSQYSPTDGLPAEDSTEVLVWYSPTAIYFGIRAYEPHGAVHATLADRDRIDADDYVQLFLGTFGDGRQATVIGVNPLGVQQDGTLIETGKVSSSGYFNGATVTREAPDLSPDFVFQSKGRVTDQGYEVEIRIPFKSLRYQASDVQTWGINVLRRVQHSGHEDSWAPAKRDAASFLAQSGTLEGLTSLHRGLVLDLNPELTSKATGAPASGGWDYRSGGLSLGGNARWGITNSLTLNGTLRPDFSQVEADAGQLSYDPRQALYFAEKRPFFLDAIEQFATPNNLVYTRRIVQPAVAAKLTGRVAGTSIAFLSAVDTALDENGVPLASGDHPVFNILRVIRNVGGQSLLGAAYTDRIAGADYNRVADVDGRFVFGRIYSAQFQLANSWTQRGGVATAAPLWEARVAANGRTFGVRSVLTGIDPDFRAASGFIARPGIVHFNVDPRVTLFGARGSFVESLTGDVGLDGTWQYDHFTRRGEAQDKKLHLNLNAALRGGWTAGASVLAETFGYDPALYADYYVELPAAGGGLDTVKFTGRPRIPNLDWVASLATPAFKHFSGDVFFLWGHDENFFEWASAPIFIATIDANWRPTEQLRVTATYNHQQYDRRSDGSTVARRRIPRLKVEYQLSRAVFVRLVGEYDAQQVDSLRDESRTGAPILIRDPAAGTFTRPAARRANDLRADWLFSYQPTPGTVLFLGYGSTMAEPTPLGFRDLQRTSDAFFVKASYLFRL